MPHDGRIQRGRLEIGEQLPLDWILLHIMLVVRAQVHRLRMCASGEVEITGTVHIRADQRRSAINAMLREVLGELFEMPVAVHRREHHLMLAEMRRGALKKFGKLMLFDEHDPYVRVSGILLRVVHVDRHQVASLTVLRHIGTTLFANLLDVLGPGVHEIHLLMCEFLQQHAILNAHAACSENRVFH